jgi:putative ABC transport system permease protein
VIELAADFNLATEEKIITQLQAALPTANVSGVRQAVMGRNELLNSFSRFGGFAAGLIVVTGVLVVALTMSASVRERTREIGIFRAIGFRSSHIFTIIITESILVSALGGIVGYHSGLLASSIAAPLLIGSAVDSAWQLPTLLTATLITAATGGLASLYPAIKAANLDPAEALRFV